MLTLFTRIKDFWPVIVAAPVPIVGALICAIGRKDGSYTEKVRRMEDAARTERHRAEFYKHIGEASNEAQATKPASRDELTDRLRKHGL